MLIYISHIYTNKDCTSSRQHVMLSISRRNNRNDYHTKMLFAMFRKYNHCPRFIESKLCCLGQGIFQSMAGVGGARLFPPMQWLQKGVTQIPKLHNYFEWCNIDSAPTQWQNSVFLLDQLAKACLESSWDSAWGDLCSLLPSKFGPLLCATQVNFVCTLNSLCSIPAPCRFFPFAPWI